MRTVVLGMLAHGDAVHPNVQLIRRMYLSPPKLPMFKFTFRRHQCLVHADKLGQRNQHSKRSNHWRRFGPAITALRSVE